MSLNDFYATCAIPKVYRVKNAVKAGPTRKARAKKRRRLVKMAAPIRDAVLALDHAMCRWPECEVPPDTFWGRIEVAHWEAAGMGGDPTLARYTLENLICMCRWHHQGPRGLHDGAKLEPLSEQGMRGHVECFQRERGEGGKWYTVGISHPPSETRN